MAGGDRQDDASLLKAWRSGDEAAGSRLVRGHFDTLMRFFEGRVDRDSVEDLLATTFEACVASKDRMPEDVPFRAYLLGIARNKLLMHLRHRRVREGVQELEHDPRDGSTLRPSRFAAAREEESLLLKALRCLRLDHQIALELFYWEDMDTGSIATVLGIPRGTVKTRLARARSQLKEHVERLSSSPALATSTINELEHWVESMRRRRG